MKAFRGGLFGCFGVGAAIVIVIIVIAVLANAGKGGSSTTSSGKPVVAKALLDKSGSGQWTSPKFTTQGDEWSIIWTYDCASFGQQGNFVVSAVGSDGLPNPVVNQLGMKGADTTSQHKGGTFYLEVNSECAWTVQVKG